MEFLEHPLKVTLKLLNERPLISDKVFKNISSVTVLVKFKSSEINQRPNEIL